MAKLTLRASTRTVLGKKVKQLRKEGVIPGNIFGSDFKSAAIGFSYKDFASVYRIARETGIIYIQVDKEKEEIPTLTKNVQRDPVKDTILHVDFRKVNLKEKVTADVPVEVAGQSEAVAQKGGVLLTQSNSLLVEALPQDMPQAIAVDISVLKEIGNEIKVKDLSKSSSYEIKEDAEKVVVSVVAHKEESVTPETTAATPEVITEAKPEEGAAEEGKEAKEVKETKKEQPAEKPAE